MQTITQTKKYRCVSLSRPSSQPEPEPERIQQSWIPKRFSFIVTRSPSIVTKLPSSGTKLPFSGTKLSTPVPKSQSSVTKPPTDIPKSSPTSSSVSKPPSSDQKLPSSKLKMPSDSFSLFKFPLQLISSLLSPLVPHTIRQNTSSVITPLFSVQMPLTFSTIHSPNTLPCIKNNLPDSCNPQPGIINNIPISYNTVPAGNINNSPYNSEPNSNNPNSDVEILNNSPTPLPGFKNKNKTQNIPCDSDGKIKNNVPNSGNTLSGKKNNSTHNCNSQVDNTNKISSPCNTSSTIKNNPSVLCNPRLDNINNTSHNTPYIFLSGNSPIKALIHRLLCNFFMKNINGFKCNVLIDMISSTPKPYEPTPYKIKDDSTSSTPLDEIDYSSSTPANEITSTTFTTNSPTTTPSDGSTTSCVYPPTSKIYKPCLSPTRVLKPIPCKTYIPPTCKGPLDHPYSSPPLNEHSLNHESYSTPNTNLYSSLKSKLDKSTQLTLSQEEIILKMLEILISTSNSS